MRFISDILRTAAILFCLAGPLGAQSTADVAAPDTQVTASKQVVCATTSGKEISGEFLRRVARCLYGEDGQADPVRVALVDDLYIKSWSYTVLNKGFFWLSVALAISVLMWPALGPIFGPAPTPEGTQAKAPSRFQRAISAPAVQTSITALAAFSFAFYAHYKEKQAVSESLMRQVIFAETLEQDQIDAVVKRLSEMDRGFGFATSSTDLSTD
jgi:hypothetical protein